MEDPKVNRVKVEIGKIKENKVIVKVLEDKAMMEEEEDLMVVPAAKTKVMAAQVGARKVVATKDKGKVKEDEVSEANKVLVEVIDKVPEVEEMEDKVEGARMISFINNFTGYKNMIRR